MHDDIRQPLPLLNITIALHGYKPRRFAAVEARKMEAYFISLFPNHKQFVILQFCPSEEYAMARFKQSTFSSLRLTRDDEKAFTKWVQENNPEPVECVQQLLGTGFKVSCSWIFDQSAFCFSVIGTENTKKHDNMVMTTWSDDLAEVMTLAFYKHFVICGGDEWPAVDTTQRWG